jgi:catechol 2,3-dioxygenase-like lactoylglutathione lyase family enzyme
MEPRISIITFGVADLERSYQFYKDGLGFPTSGNPSDGIVFFKTAGARFAIYPKDKLAEEFDGKFASETGTFRSFTVAHNTRSKEEVEAVLKLAEPAGGKIKKTRAGCIMGGVQRLLFRSRRLPMGSRLRRLLEVQRRWQPCAGLIVVSRRCR